ncbi:protein odr-4 homolog isoform X2 [Hylaeus volcanicus]|uniref:protein odr-4 homolog isoform X2 n=1 Tax=Hylaeus volcanicus TaxID=313075 RepID=UPI0023B78170|nr:protein odr-4 homolog isoform X2 [Hylaeus volcanicus]
MVHWNFSAGQKDYIVHLAKTPPPLGKNVVEETLISSTTNVQQETAENYIKSVRDIPESWVADHAKHVTRMLPGGMHVLGAFIVGPDDTMNENINVQKIKSILMAIQRNLMHNKYLCGDNNEEHLILSLNSITQKYICKSIETNKTGMLKPAEWKFQGKATKWHQLEALVDFDRLFLIAADKDPETLKTQLQDILENISHTIESSITVIEGDVRSPDDPLEIISKSKKDKKGIKNNEKNSNDKSIQINLYIPCQEKHINSNVRITPCNASIRLVGQLASRTFVHQKANVEEANVAVKQDIIRSLASRLEMHWDSLIEEENGSPEENITLHEPPRRVLIALPESKVTLSDYLFPGEGPQEALLSLQELLDLEVNESNVQKDIEVQADPTEFYCQSEIDVKPSDLGKDSSGNNQTTVYVAGISIAVIILIIAIIIHKLY